MKTDFKRNFFGGGVKAGKKKIQRILGKIENQHHPNDGKILIFVRHFARFYHAVPKSLFFFLFFFLFFLFFFLFFLLLFFDLFILRFIIVNFWSNLFNGFILLW